MKHEQPQLPFEPAPQDEGVNEVVAHSQVVARVIAEEAVIEQPRVQVGSAKREPTPNYDPDGYKFASDASKDYGGQGLSTGAQTALRHGDQIYLRRQSRHNR